MRTLNELLGTKLRALYQRRKGRDLFDLWLGLTAGKANPSAIVESFQKYMSDPALSVTQDEFRKNLALKIKNTPFLGDTNGLLRSEIAYNALKAYHLIDESLLKLL